MPSTSYKASIGVPDRVKRGVKLNRIRQILIDAGIELPPEHRHHSQIRRRSNGSDPATKFSGHSQSSLGVTLAGGLIAKIVVDFTKVGQGQRHLSSEARLFSHLESRTVVVLRPG